MCNCWLTFQLFISDRVPQLHARLQLSATEAASVRGVWSVLGDPWQWSAAGWSFWWQAASGLHHHQNQTGWAEGECCWQVIGQCWNGARTNEGWWGWCCFGTSSAFTQEGATVLSPVSVSCGVVVTLCLKFYIQCGYILKTPHDWCIWMVEYCPYLRSFIIILKKMWFSELYFEVV